MRMRLRLRESQKEVWRFPHMSQECRDGPRAHLSQGDLTVEYDYEPYARDDWVALHFTGVGAFAFTYQEACTTAQVDAYDCVLEVAKSSWLRRLGVDAEGHQSSLPMRNFRMYFDEYGCYDIAAETFNGPRTLRVPDLDVDPSAVVAAYERRKPAG